MLSDVGRFKIIKTPWHTGYGEKSATAAFDP